MFKQFKLDQDVSVLIVKLSDERTMDNLKDWVPLFLETYINNEESARRDLLGLQLHFEDREIKTDSIDLIQLPINPSNLSVGFVNDSDLYKKLDIFGRSKNEDRMVILDGRGFSAHIFPKYK